MSKRFAHPVLSGSVRLNVGGVTASLVSVLTHVGVLILLAVFYLPSHGESDHEIVLRVREPQSTIELATLEFEPQPFATMDAASVSQTSDREESVAFAEIELTIVDPVRDVVLRKERGEGTNVGPLQESSAVSPTSQKARDYSTYFFGIPAKGRRFVYILDMSTSMRESTDNGFSRFQIAASELLRAVDDLEDDQEFLVAAFCYQSFFFAANQAKPKMMKATPENKKRLLSWIYHLQLASGTDPRLGVVAGLRLKPDAVFLLSDGEFNGRKKNRQRVPGNLTTEQLIMLNRRANTPIHTIAFEEDDSRARLAAIARATGGKHRFVDN